MNFKAKFFTICVLQYLIYIKSPRAFHGQYLTSPCPQTFQYKFDEAGILYGLIQTECPDDTVINLDVELTVGNGVKGYNGQIDLVYSKEKVADDILHKRPIYYKLHFPFWNVIPPKITKISVNGVLLCRGTPIPVNMVPILTTINLKNRLTLNTVDLIPLSRPNDNIIKNSDGIRNPWSFKPAMPEDPTKIYHYATNPFLQRTSFDVNRNPKVTNPIIQNSSFDINRSPKTATNNDNIEIIRSEGSKLNLGDVFFDHKKPAISSSTSVGTNITPSQNNIAPTQNDIAPSQITIAPNRNNIAPSQSNVSPNQNNNIPSRNHIAPSRNNIARSIKPDFGRIGSFKQPYPDICGLPLTSSTLIVHGHDVPRGAYPWLVALFGVEQAGLEFRCSGSLITNSHVVTAAHCVQSESSRLKVEEVIVVLGRLNIQRWSLSDGSIMMDAADIAVHPDYRTQSSDADIAVIKLKEPVEFTQHIKPICLWSEPENLELVTGVNGTVVGWGRNEDGLRTTRIPYYVTLPIVTQEACLRSDAQFRYITSERTFCAGTQNGVGPCNGDSGSGFIIRRNGRWMLRGIVSMAISDPTLGTCDLSNYIVFCDATKFTSWIINIIQ